MKQHNVSQLLIKIVIAILNALPAYMIYLLVSPWPRNSLIEFYWIIVVAIVGFVLNMISIPNLKEATHSKIVIMVSVVTSILLSFFNNSNGNTISLLATFILLLWVWSRAVKSFFEDYKYMYSVEQFYQNIVILVLINIFTVVNKLTQYLQPNMTRYTILYIVIAVLILFEVRNNKYLKDIKVRKASYDFLFTVGILALTFIMSTEKALTIAYNILSSIYGFVYPILFKIAIFVLTPVAFFIEYIAGKLKPKFAQSLEQISKAYGNYEKLSPDKFDNTLIQTSDLPGKIFNFFTIIVMIFVVIIIVYIIYKSIDRFVRKQVNDDFTEEKNFEVNINFMRLSEFYKHTKEKAINVYKKATFNIRADNREKLRHEYMIFLNKIYSKNIIDKENITAQEVQNIICETYPNTSVVMGFITNMYEDVRYGNKMPEITELKDFKIRVVQLLKIII